MQPSFPLDGFYSTLHRAMSVKDYTFEFEVSTAAFKAVFQGSRCGALRQSYNANRNWYKVVRVQRMQPLNVRLKPNANLAVRWCWNFPGVCSLKIMLFALWKVSLILSTSQGAPQQTELSSTGTDQSSYSIIVAPKINIHLNMTGV